MKRRLLWVLVFALLAACLPSALAASFDARINSSSSRVYSAPSTYNTRSVKGVAGVKVKVTGYQDGWARISYKGNTGYMRTKYLNLVNRKTAYTKGSTAVYKSASTASRMGTLPIASKVYVIGVDGSFCRVQNKSGSVTGYIKTSNLASYSQMKTAYNSYKKKQEQQKKAEQDAFVKPTTKPQTPSTGGTVTGTGVDRAISAGKAVLGAEYAIDDNPPYSFNCSSFVVYCMGKAGYDMMSTARTQAADTRYELIDKNDIQKGDILCFDTNGDNVCDHTAIALSANRFIEASEGAGKVREKDFDNAYRGFLMFARRPSK